METVLIILLAILLVCTIVVAWINNEKYKVAETALEMQVEEHQKYVKEHDLKHRNFTDDKIIAVIKVFRHEDENKDIHVGYTIHSRFKMGNENLHQDEIGIYENVKKRSFEVILAESCSVLINRINLLKKQGLKI